MTDILLDTNYFVALLDTPDKWNKIAVEIFTALQKNKIKNIISFDTDFDRIKGINRISKKEFELK